MRTTLTILAGLGLPLIMSCSIRDGYLREEGGAGGASGDENAAGGSPQSDDIGHGATASLAGGGAAGGTVTEAGASDAGEISGNSGSGGDRSTGRTGFAGGPSEAGYGGDGGGGGAVGAGGGGGAGESGGSATGGPTGTGEPCVEDSECASSQCVDGVCCASACSGVCSRCDATGSEGSCVAAVSDDACGEPSCPHSTDCREYVLGNIEGNCEDIGVCVTTPSCTVNDAPDGTECGSGESAGACDGAGECVVEGRAGLGEACGGDAECGSAHCVFGEDGAGTCCDDACDGVCEACGSDGHCNAAPADDERCEIDCEESSACVTYPLAPAANRCVGFGQCVAEEVACAPEHAASGVVCGTGMLCDGEGACESACATGQVWCDDSCVDPMTSATYCGASGDCAGVASGQTCDADETCVWGECRRWRGPELVGEGGTPQIVVDRAGNVSIVAGGTNVVSYHRAAGVTVWEEGQPTSRTGLNGGYVDMDAAGKVWAVWWDDVDVMVNSFVPSVGWAADETVLSVSTDGAPNYARLSANDRGDVVVTWDTADEYVRAARYDASGASWGARDLLNESELGTAVTNRGLAVDPEGNSVAVWRTADMLKLSAFRAGSVPQSWDFIEDYVFGCGTMQDFYAAEGCLDVFFALTADWGAWPLAFGLSIDVQDSIFRQPELLGGPEGSSAYLASAGCDGFDVRFAAWHQKNAEDISTVQVRRFATAEWTEDGSRWELTGGNGDADPVSISIAPSGSAVLAWTERTGSALAVVASRYDHRYGTWSDPSMIATGVLDARSTQYRIDTAIDGQERAYVSWSLDGAVYLAEYR